MWPKLSFSPDWLENVRLITGRSHPELANAVAKDLGIRLMDCTVTTFSNTESRIKPSTGEDNTFRGKHMFVLQTGSFGNGCSVNDHVMETKLLMDACRRGGCKSITLVLPFYPYVKTNSPQSGVRFPF